MSIYHRAHDTSSPALQIGPTTTSSVDTGVGRKRVKDYDCIVSAKHQCVDDDAMAETLAYNADCFEQGTGETIGKHRRRRRVPDMH